MHEEWRDTMRTARTEVQLTGAGEVTVTAPFTVIYRPYRIEVESSWPGAKIGNGHTSVHLFANEVYWNGAVSRLSITLQLSDLDEVPEWLALLVQAAEARNFG